MFELKLLTKVAVPKALERAIELHQAGDLPGAMREYELCIAAEPGRVEAPPGKQARRLGSLDWYESHGTDEKGQDYVELLAPLDGDHLAVHAWCDAGDCTPEGRDELAEQVAAAARLTSR